MGPVSQGQELSLQHFLRELEPEEPQDKVGGATESARPLLRTFLADLNKGRGLHAEVGGILASRSATSSGRDVAGTGGSAALEMIHFLPLQWPSISVSALLSKYNVPDFLQMLAQFTSPKFLHSDPGEV